MSTWIIECGSCVRGGVFSSSVVILIMSLSEIKSFEGLVKFESTLDQSPHALKQMLRSNHLIRSQGRRCCRSRRMQEGALGREPIFGRVWRCTVCRKTESFLKDSYFEQSHLPPFTILKMAYIYVETGIGGDLMRTLLDDPPSNPIIIDWMQFFRDIMSKEVIEETRGKVGGPGKMIVVDETALSSRKYHRGKPVARETCWVLAVYDVENKQGILEYIDNRSRGEMVPKIVEKVEAGSIICSDQHRSYMSLAAHGYEHRTVNHSETFKARDGTHTNHVEGYFSRLKAFLRRKNVKNVSFIPSYIDEFMWRERHHNSKWSDFLEAVQRQYRVR